MAGSWKRICFWFFLDVEIHITDINNRRFPRRRRFFFEHNTFKPTDLKINTNLPWKNLSFEKLSCEANIHCWGSAFSMYCFFLLLWLEDWMNGLKVQESKKTCTSCLGQFCWCNIFFTVPQNYPFEDSPNNFGHQHFWVLPNFTKPLNWKPLNPSGGGSIKVHDFCRKSGNAQNLEKRCCLFPFHPTKQFLKRQTTGMSCPVLRINGLVHPLYR